MAKRRFHFLSTALLGGSRRSHDALVDVDYAALAERLDAWEDMPADNFAKRFEAKLHALKTDESTPKAGTGHAGTLTREQRQALDEIERLVAGARRSVRLAFPDNPVKLHSEFQVGVNEPGTLDAELDRAQIILASCKKAGNAAALKDEGWLAKDTAALAGAMGQFDKLNLAKTGALDDRIGLTSQNAARLEYPSTEPGTEGSRKRFLLDEFPPRDRSEPTSGTQAPTAPSGPSTPATPPL